MFFKFHGKRKQAGPSGEPRPFRIGMWCDYGAHFSPARGAGGIGVFVHNLVGGLLELEEPVEVVMLVRQGDQRLARTLQAAAPGRLHVIPEKLKPLSAAWFIATWTRAVNRLRRPWRSLKARQAELRETMRMRLKGALRSVERWALKKHPMLAALAGVGLAFALLPVWAVYTLGQLALALGKSLLLPVRLGNRALERLSASPLGAALSKTSLQIAQEADCDVWVIPYVGFQDVLPFPAVLFIHDLVTSHYPEMFDAGFVSWINTIAPARAAEAKICACMSGFIRDTDLLGVLGLSTSKVRMVRFAPPRDFPELSDERAQELKPACLQRPFVFSPGGIRTYKNQRVLIEALACLRDQLGESPLDLVLTGDEPGERLPAGLERLAMDLKIRERIHVLGRVDRETLSALYRTACATVMPTLYEECCFPIYEALHYDCPVACSDIPSLRDSLREQSAALDHAMLYFDPHDPQDVARALLQIRDDRDGVRARQHEASRSLWQRTWKDAAREWLAVFREAAGGGAEERGEVARWPIGVDRRLLKPWPIRPAVAARPPDRLHVFLFQQVFYLGGVWEATKNLVQQLVSINRERGRLAFTLGIDEEQQDLCWLDCLRSELTIERIRLNPITRADMIRMLGAPVSASPAPAPSFCFFSGGAETALAADAWFGLVDRFRFPLLPVRPYGVLVHDMLQKHMPAMFGDADSGFWQSVIQGMSPTIQRAALVTVTTPQTQGDVLSEYGLDPDRVRLIPLACDPHLRFEGLLPQPVAVPREPFILHIANTAEHKGAEVVLRAYARLRQRGGGQPPALVMCGVFTEKFSAAHASPGDHPHWVRMRDLVRALRLKEGEDVVFLGYVNEAQVKHLYERCGVVVNAAKHDNGSYSLIEGAYFGRPVVSTRYPSAEFICERFGVPARFFPIDDDGQLARALEQALMEQPLTGQALELARARLAERELSVRRYAERVYDCLVELAEQGRREREAAWRQAAA